MYRVLLTSFFFVSILYLGGCASLAPIKEKVQQANYGQSDGEVSNEIKEKIGSWNLLTTIDEFTGKVASREGWSRDTRSNGDVLAIDVYSLFNCNHFFRLVLNSSDDELISRLNEAKEPKFRIRVDENTMILVPGEVVKSETNGPFVQINLENDYAVNEELIKQMLAGKELLIDFNPNNHFNLNSVVGRFDLEGFDEIYSRMCKK